MTDSSVCLLVRSGLDHSGGKLNKIVVPPPISSDPQVSSSFNTNVINSRSSNPKYADYREHEGIEKSTSQTSAETEMVIQQEHQARTVFELSCPAGVPVIVLSREDPLFWKVKYQGKQGLVPKYCFIRKVRYGDSSDRTRRRTVSLRQLSSRPSALSLPTVFESQGAALQCRQALTPPPQRRSGSFSWFLFTRRSGNREDGDMSHSKAPPVAPPRPAHTLVDIKSKQRLSMTRSAGLPSDYPVQEPAHVEPRRAHSDATRSISLPAGLYLVPKQQNELRPSSRRPQSYGAKAKAKLTRLLPGSSGKKSGRPLPQPPVSIDDSSAQSPTLHTTYHIAGQGPDGQPVFARHTTAIPTPDRAGLRRMASWSGNGSMSMVSKETLSMYSRQQQQQRRSIHGAQHAPHTHHHSGPLHCQCCHDYQQSQYQHHMNSPRTSREENVEEGILEGNRRQPLARTTSTPNHFSDSLSVQTALARQKKRSFDNSIKYRAFDWFYGRMSRDRAELLLIKYGKDEDYLLRERELEQGTYALAVRVTSTLVRHFRIFESTHGYSCNINSDTECPSLVDLVLHHEKFALCGAGAAKDSYFLYQPMDRTNIPASEGVPPVLDSADIAPLVTSDYHNSFDGLWQHHHKNYVESNATRPKPLPRSEANMHRVELPNGSKDANRPQSPTSPQSNGAPKSPAGIDRGVNGTTVAEVHSPPAANANTSTHPPLTGKTSNGTPPIPEEEVEDSQVVDTGKSKCAEQLVVDISCTKADVMPECTGTSDLTAVESAVRDDK